MKAVIFYQHGGPEQLRYEEVPDPIIGPGEVLIRVKACALNYLDLWVRQGIPAYQIPLPHVSGCDVSGIIEEKGDETECDCIVGQSVFIFPGLSCWRCRYCLTGRENLCSQFKVVGAQVDGGYAEFVKVPAINVFPLPSNITFDQAAAFPLVSVTAWHMVFGLAKLQAGETVLILGAGGGVGSMAVQMATLIGARVIATVGSEEKIAKVQDLGVEVVLNHTHDHFVTRVRELTGGQGVDVVIEHIGEQVWDQCVQVLSRGGRLVTCGATTGGESKINIRLVFSRQLTIMGSYMGTRGELAQAVSLICSGKLTPVLDRVLPLAEARQAQELMLNRQVFGKVVLAVS